MIKREQDLDMLYADAATTRASENKGLQYEILDDGADALLLSGKFANKRVRDLLSFEKGKNYLGWIFTNTDLEDLKCVVERVFHEGRDKKK